MRLDKKLLKDNKYIRFGIFIAYMAIVATLFPRNKISTYNYDIGSPWLQSDVVAPFTFPIYKDLKEYELQKEVARQSVLPVFRRSHKEFSPDHFQRYLDSLTATIAAKLNSQYLSQDSLVNLRREPFLKDLSAKEFQLLLGNYKQSLTDKEKSSLLQKYRRVIPLEISILLSDGILDETKPSINSSKFVIRSENDREETVHQASSVRDYDEAVLAFKELTAKRLGRNLSQNSDTVSLALKLAKPFLTPNILFDGKETQLAKKRAESAVPIADGIVRENEKIISRGERMTPLTKRMLDSFLRAKAEREADTGEIRIYIGKFLTVIIISSLFSFFIYLFRERIYHDNAALALICIIILLELIATWQALHYDWMSPYIVPIGLAAILFTTLFDSRIALFATITISLLAATIRGNDFQFAIASIFSGGIGVFVIKDLRQRTQIFLTVLLIFVGYLLSITAFSLSRLSPLEEILNDIFYAAISSMLCFFIYPIVLLIEKTFGITTDLALLELSDTNHPLLKEMSLQAPGTFHHTMMVSMLSERAAAEIGANQLLCRVGAYFHDIGKTPNANYFTENQSSANPHDKLDPIYSSRIIAAHVSDGVAIGRQYKLPEVILDFIPQHHGTSVMQFFFDKALKITPNGLPIEDFQYPGPKPQTKESAIVMLADGVEASVRSLSEHTETTISQTIENVVKKRFDENQFTECPITLDEINQLKRIFLNTLMAAHHKRIKYPGQKL
ncbi:metal dependent phosphohydrolase [Chloroherpeton thalassium ATCC 35110]|uniref:Metal dependent phosphohydrolase n=1 Tax=Chloroherpeton thalassium (strain ATCC 35110 / GB-78) TaxID=517418 RepID=B3QV05_CHLT3|nr:HDIG domain-containing metalloprotein [Chloroherpeton thalassium]ACF14506.1 metal dependent phosphohydrolase [Chloroherpeton thalassium ATCC 35110]